MHRDDAKNKEETGFPIRVTYHDYKTGLVEKQEPYIMREVGDGGSKLRYWERPAGSGNVFDGENRPIGRWNKDKPEGQRFLKGEPHVEWKAPETSDDKLARSVALKDVKIQELERELASIKAEREKKSAPVKKDQGA